MNGPGSQKVTTMPTSNAGQMTAQQFRDFINDRPLNFTPLLYGEPLTLPAAHQPAATTSVDLSHECPRYRVALPSIRG